MGIVALASINIILAMPLLNNDPVDDPVAASTRDQDRLGEVVLPDLRDDEDARPIVLRSTTRAAEKLHPVKVTGRYPDGSEGTKLVVQWRYQGAWVTLPLPTAVLPTGRFSTYVQLGKDGQQRLRVVDKESGTVSNPVTLTIL
jgi:hypothetical protein